MHHPEILQLIRKAVECELEGTWIFQRYTMAELAEIYNGIGPGATRMLFENFV